MDCPRKSGTSGHPTLLQMLIAQFHLSSFQFSSTANSTCRVLSQTQWLLFSEWEAQISWTNDCSINKLILFTEDVCFFFILDSFSLSFYVLFLLLSMTVTLNRSILCNHNNCPLRNMWTFPWRQKRAAEQYAVVKEKKIDASDFD